MLIIDLRVPGVTVRPLRDMAGRKVFNEVFLDRVRVPAGRVVGALHGGWAAAMRMLEIERHSPVIRGSAGSTTVEQLVAAVDLTGHPHRHVLQDRLAHAFVHQRALALYRARLEQLARAGDPPGGRGSVAKLAWARLDRSAADLAVQLLGGAVLAWSAGAVPAAGDRSELPAWATAICVAPATGIAGGTDEIQRTIIGERVLGLPRG